MSAKMRVRLAPSPTGFDIHLGNLRTALYNWLIARQHKGTFILRMENSDVARSKQEYADNILKTLHSIGLSPDEGYGCKNQDFGPYMQSQKLDRYNELANQLIETGYCYRCYCTQEELGILRKDALTKNPKAPFKYSGKCRDRKDQLKNQPFVIRFKAPVEGETILNDKVFGTLVFPHKENYDFVIARSDKTILYNYGCVVDDIDQQITLVIRGKDHLANFVQQSLLYQALGGKIPEMAHLSMINNQQGQKLSKRDCATSVGQYIELGYSPRAVLNYLAKLGWGNGDDEIFSLDELLTKFSLENCKRSDCKFDTKKFATVNTEHLKSEALTPNDTYAKLLKPFIDAKKIGEISEATLIQCIPVIRSRAKTFVEAADLLEPMLKEEVSPDQELIRKTITPQTKEYLQAINAILNATDPWNETTLKNNIQQWLTEKKLSLKDVGASLRTSLLGTPNSPEIFQVLNVLGKTKAMKRIGAII